MHVEYLLDTYDVRYRDIAREAGVSPETVRNIMNGNVDSVYRPTARRILNVWSFPKSHPKSRAILVSGTPTKRRLEALGCIGYSREHVAQLIGMSASTLRGTRQLRSLQVTTHDRVKVFYNRRKRIPPPETWRTRMTVKNARESGYAPPWAWPAGTIDDDTARPRLDEIEDAAWLEAIRLRYDLTSYYTLDTILP